MADIYPNSPGYRPGSPDTSRLAAEAVAADAKSLEARCLRAITDAAAHGLTSDEVAEKLDLANHYQSRPRLSTLHASGKIVDSSRRRRNGSGRLAVVWVASQFAPMPALLADGGARG